MTNKEFFKKVNEIAKRDLLIAAHWIESYNREHSTHYQILDRRVVFVATDHGHTDFHDAEIWANDEKI